MYGVGLSNFTFVYTRTSFSSLTDHLVFDLVFRNVTPSYSGKTCTISNFDDNRITRKILYKSLIKIKVLRMWFSTKIRKHLIDFACELRSFILNIIIISLGDAEYKFNDQ